MKKLIITFFIVLIKLQSLLAQKIHVHNDYEQSVPFWGAIVANVDAIEIDVYLKQNKLFVAHEERTIDHKKTLQKLYLKPLQQALELGFLTHTKELQLLIDIKSDPYSTLKLVVEEFQKFFTQNKKNKISVIISGNRPKEEDYQQYPSFIKFDYQQTIFPADEKIISKIGLISYDFKQYSVWNGKGKIIAKENEKLKNIIAKVHQFNKPIRFWATPDSKSAWKALSDLKIDYINTNQPTKCTDYLKSLPKRWFKNTIFSKVYKPTFETDNKTLPVKNIILMVGDGNGLSQISSAVLANGGNLTLTQLKSVGFIKTQSADDFIVDSAASATALATGEKTYNRAVGVDLQGGKIENITEYLSRYNYNSAFITTDEVFGATPSAFYAHQVDRDCEEEIAKELLTSKLTLFIGGGSRKIPKSLFEQHQFKIINKIENIAKNNSDKIGYFFSEGGVPSVLEGRGNVLAEATKSSLSYLKNKETPFFVMIEGAQIDNYGHHNDVSGVVTETIDFDRAITEAVKFADKDKETLVIILADHETGGFAISQGNTQKHYIEGDFITHDHTGVLVPVFAYGPQSYEFEGCYDNSEVFDKILKVIGHNK